MPGRDFARLAIALRSEPAMRVVHAVRELRAQRADSMQLIALHSDAERDAMFVRHADAAVCLDEKSLEQALREARADAAWLDGDVVGEQLDAAELCERLGIVCVGQTPDSLRRLRDNIDAHRAAAGGRRLAVPIIADGHGEVWTLGACDVSCRHGGKAVLAESSSPALTDEQELEVCAAARRLALDAGYVGAGRLEFTYEPSSARLSLAAVGAWPGPAVAEAVTGLDLVKLQLHIAAGGRLEGEQPAAVGHAIEAHLRAEDPSRAFAPAPGRLVHLRLPSGPGVRVDTGVAEGDNIAAGVDPTIANVIASGRDRYEALGRLRRAVTDTVAILDGGTSTEGFLARMLEQPDVRAGRVDADWLDRMPVAGAAGAVPHGDVALVGAAIELADMEAAEDRARFYALARRGRPRAALAVSRIYELHHLGHAYRLGVSQIAPDRYRVTLDGQPVELTARRATRLERRLELPAGAHRTLTSVQGHDLIVEVDGVPHRISRDDGGYVRAPGPALVVAVPAAEGDIVEAGDVVAVVEAMKMESSLTAPFRGRIKRVFAGENVHVAAQAPLVALEPVAPESQAAPGARLSFESLAARADAAPDPCRENLRRMEWLVLGYDVDALEVERTITDLHGECADLLSCDPALIPGEHRLLEMFADMRAVARADRLDQEQDSTLLGSPQEHLHAWLRSLDADAERLPAQFTAALRQVLRHYGIASLERTPGLEEACYRLFLAQQRADIARRAIVAILDRRLEDADQLVGNVGDDFREALDRLVIVLEGRDPVLADLAREVRFRYFDEPVIAKSRARVYEAIEPAIAALTSEPESAEAPDLIREIAACPRPLATRLTGAMGPASPVARRRLVEAMARRYYRERSLGEFQSMQLGGTDAAVAWYTFAGVRRQLVTAYVELDELSRIAQAFAEHAATLPAGRLAVLDLYALHDGTAPSVEETATRVHAALSALCVPPTLHRIVVAVAEPRRGQGMSAIDLFTFRPGSAGLIEDEVLRGLHPMMAQRLRLWRLREFELKRLASPEDIYVFRGVARANARDERLFALGEVRDLTAVRDERGRLVAVPELEQALVDAFEALRVFQARRPMQRRLVWNRVLLHAWPVIELHPDEIRGIVERVAPRAAGLGLELVSVQGRLQEEDGSDRDRVLNLFMPTGHDVAIEVHDPPAEALQPLDEGTRRISAARRRGLLHPAEIVKLLAPAEAHAGRPTGSFVEYELGANGRLEPIDRPPGMNPTGIVVGTIRNFTERYPEGMLRVVLLGDPTRSLGSLAEPECRRIVAAIDMAEELGVPLEWFALSAGAKIAMDSGTETMDWIAVGLRRIVSFTQAGGELNVVVAGITVGAQPYCAAEATMLMHTRGALIMTAQSSMLMAGKQALDFSGGVSAEDNLGIGGYERIMGPNGQAQYWAADLADACRLLLRYYEHTYVAPGERFPRRATTRDPIDRDIAQAPHGGFESELRTVGDVFSDEANRDRKHPFDIRSVMRAVIDADHAPLERWPDMLGGEVAVVWDAHLGGQPLSLIGIESRPLPRRGAIPADGPERWTAGTLFPRAAKKIARALNAAGGRRPVVVLANLAGFDGSPESLRDWQLEFGAEIARAVVNFDGPIVFCVLSRYHGGAFVVFSQRLNENLRAVAVRGARASVIGGAPAAAVVFAADVAREAAADGRIKALDGALAQAEGAERQALRARRAQLWETVLAEKRREFAERFDRVHSIERAVQMGSVSAIIDPASLRSFLIAAVQRGIERAVASNGAQRAGNAVNRPVVMDEHAAVMGAQQPPSGNGP
jgi:acetyl/propionyl-CoA carboxylase alpha subunit/acetyl-CoA carboxylase carboxyltransferase component